MDWDSRAMRGDGPTVFAQAKNGVGIEIIVDHVLRAKAEAL
jgi:urease accessory protein